MEEDDDGPWEPPAAIELPITDELDLHHFAPAEVAEVVESYCTEAAERGFREVRIIHGKGRGTLRRTVESVLARHPNVADFAAAPEHRGGWGATLVRLQGPARTGVIE